MTHFSVFNFQFFIRPRERRHPRSIISGAYCYYLQIIITISCSISCDGGIDVVVIHCVWIFTFLLYECYICCGKDYILYIFDKTILPQGPFEALLGSKCYNSAFDQPLMTLMMIIIYSLFLYCDTVFSKYFEKANEATKNIYCAFLAKTFLSSRKKTSNPPDKQPFSGIQSTSVLSFHFLLICGCLSLSRMWVELFLWATGYWQKNNFTP